jgi:hypothetical protein
LFAALSLSMFIIEAESKAVEGPEVNVISNEIRNVEHRNAGMKNPERRTEHSSPLNG